MPIVLAQLLRQFQQPPMMLNVTTPALETTTVEYLTTTNDALDYFNLSNRTRRQSDDDTPYYVDVDQKPASEASDKFFRQLEDYLIFMWNDAGWLSAMIVVLTLLSCFVVHHSDLRQRMVGARMRIACCSAIYRKTLRISKKAADKIGAGKHF